MPAKAEAQEAIEEMNSKDFMGRNLKVEEGRPKTNRYRGGGRGRRGGFGGNHYLQYCTWRRLPGFSACL